MKMNVTNEEDLFNNPHIKKQLSEMSKCKGRVSKFMIKIREGRVTEKEVSEWLKKDYKNVEKAWKKKK